MSLRYVAVTSRLFACERLHCHCRISSRIPAIAVLARLNLPAFRQRTLRHFQRQVNSFVVSHARDPPPPLCNRRCGSPTSLPLLRLLPLSRDCLRSLTCYESSQSISASLTDIFSGTSLLVLRASVTDKISTTLQNRGPQNLSDHRPRHGIRDPSSTPGQVQDNK